MNHDHPFTAHGDEALEARIVAWVLGEASAFEVAELERLCAERPELLVFKRRMTALHGLLAEAENSMPDESWKLAPGKRKAVEYALWKKNLGNIEDDRERRVKRNGRRALLAIAACLLLLVIIAGLLAPAGIRHRKKSDIAETRSNEMQQQLALLEDSERSQRLRTDLPAELIEGTPQSMKVPNLEAPADGPAGSETWSLAARDESEKSKNESAPAITRKPSPPASSRAKAIVANTVSGTAVPVPDVDVTTPSLDFGDGDLGTGWGGGGSGGGFARDSRIAANESDASPAPGRPVTNRKSGSEVATDPFADDNGLIAGLQAGQAGGDGIDVIREFAYPTEYEPPELPGQIADLTTDRAVFPETPGKPQSGSMQDQERETNLPANRGMIVDGRENKSAESGGRLEPVPTLGFRSGNPNVSGNNFDAIPQDSSGIAGNEELASQMNRAAGEKAPVLGDIPSNGRLFGMDANNGEGLRLPQITTRSGHADELMARADEKRKIGQYDDARKLLNDALAAEPDNGSIRDELKRLDDPIRTNPALTDEHRQNVDDVRRGLYTAEGNFNLGKFDDAKRAYEDVLSKDPYNQAARRGMERIKVAKSDYYRAAYDHSRAELLSQVDNSWELTVPEKETDFNGFTNFGSPIGKDDASLPDDPDALAKAVREQEDKVEERRKVLSTIVRTKGIIYKGNDSYDSQKGVDEDLGARNALQIQHELEQEKLQLESQIKSLLKYDNEQLMVYASGLNLPDNNVRVLYPKYLEAKRQLDNAKAEGLETDHPSVQAKVEQTEAMKRQIEESVVNLRATLKAQLDLATERLKSVEAIKDQTRGEAIKRGLDAQDYADAKKEFEKDQELLNQMKIKLMAATIRAKQEPPKPDLTELMEEIAASEDPYSTFSLNISDASFRIAQAALAKGEQPDPAGIKVEQFYNAVDYGDPAPAAGEPVSCEIEQAAHPVIPGRNLVRIALKTAAAGRSATQPLRLTLLVDQSGSMTRADRRAAMDAAMASLGKLLTDKDLVNIVGFSRSSRLLADGMKGDEAGRKLAELVNQSASEGGTNLETAIDLAGQMAQRRMLAGAQNRIVLFTDGAANLGDADPQRLAAKVGQLRQQGVAFDIAGIAADGLNDELLGELARKGNGRYYVVGKGAEEDFAKQLAGAFRPAAENVKVQVRFNPERVARYKLIGYEKDRLKTEDFRNDKVDAAELAAEEAGVAIYQVEPLPDGSGEIGEVSVRFRDTASGEMVERGWTIPHDAAAPAIDRATPSMQLAVLSMFAAEKLKGGPLGEAIDFRQLADAQANVKRFFGHDTRVAEMLRIVEMLK